MLQEIHELRRSTRTYKKEHSLKGKEQTENGIQFKTARAKEYPSIADQLDKIYHSGIDEWKKVIGKKLLKSVKEDYWLKWQDLQKK